MNCDVQETSGEVEKVAGWPSIYSGIGAAGILTEDKARAVYGSGY